MSDLPTPKTSRGLAIIATMRQDSLCDRESCATVQAIVVEMEHEIARLTSDRDEALTQTERAIAVAQQAVADRDGWRSLVEKGARLIGQSRFAAAAMWAEAILTTLYPPKGLDLKGIEKKDPS